MTEGLRRASFSVDAEFFGAYVRNRDASSSIRTADASCDSQPRSSRAASTDTVPGSVDREDEESGNEGPRPAARRRAEDTVRQVERRTEERIEAGAETTAGEDDASSLPSACSCEGACGCATVSRATSSSRISIEEDDQQATQEEKGEGEEREEDEDGEEDSSQLTSAIVRLLGSRSGRCGSDGSTTTSTPCGTFRRSARKISVRSREACVSRISTNGSTSSYEKLSNAEFDFGRKTLIHSSDPVSVNSSIQRRRVQGYCSCDLESLYEGIKVLDGFLARRGVSGTHGRKQSVTVMLFGTPAHGIRRRAADDEESVCENPRVSQLSLEASPSASYDTILTTDRETK